VTKTDTEQGIIAPGTTRVSARHLLPVAVLVAVAAFLHFRQLARTSLFFDEGYSIAMAQISWGEFWRQVSGTGESNMGLYYGVLHLWSDLFGSIAGMRALSGVFGVLAVIVLCDLGAKLFDRKTGVVAGFLLAANGLLLHQTHNIRGYTLLCLLTVVATRCLVSAHERSALAEHRRKTAIWWAAYAVVCALATYTHVLGAFVLPVQLACLLVMSGLRRHMLLFAAAASTLWAVLVAPFAIAMSRSEQESWIPTPDGEVVSQFVQYMAGADQYDPLSHAIPAIVCWIIGGAFAFSALRSRSERSALQAMVALFVIVTPVVLFVLSRGDQSVFFPQYMMTVLPIAALVAAYGITRVPWPAGLALLALTSFVSISNLGTAYAYERETWREAAEHVRSQAQPGDRFLFNDPIGQFSFDAYFDTDPSQGAVFRSYDETQAHAADALAQPGRVWLMTSHERDEHVNADTIAASGRTLIATEEFMEINVTLWTR
jgi:mannosyltransferase